LEVAFAAFEQGSARLVYVDYMLKIEMDYFLETTRREYQPENKAEVVLLGYKAKAMDPSKSNLIDTVERAIELAVDECPLVGRPISILRITKDSSEWIKPGRC